MWQKFIKALISFLFEYTTAPIKPLVASKAEADPSPGTGAVTATVITTMSPRPPVGSETAIKTVAAIPKLKDRSKDVMTLQERLTAFGFSCGAIDGVFGTATQKAVSAFQKSIGLKGSGLVGTQTLAKLNLSVKPVVGRPTGEWKPPSFKTQGKGRNLEPELERLIDAKLMKIAPQEFMTACETKDANEFVWLANLAFEAMKIREKTNNNDGVMVELLQETVGSAVKEPWCMAEQQSAIAYAERKTGIVSKVVADETVMTVATSTPASCKVKLSECRRGDLWCWQHGKTWKGHVGCFGHWKSFLKSAQLIEGNTTSGTLAGIIVREGGGTYLTERSVGQIGDMTLVAVIRAF